MNNSTVSRQRFLQQSAMAGAAMLLSSLKTMAEERKEKKIKVAIIGCGSVSNSYLPHLSKCPYVELVSTCES